VSMKIIGMMYKTRDFLLSLMLLSFLAIRTGVILRHCTHF
jgi:hypothetical protein